MWNEEMLLYKDFRLGLSILKWFLRFLNGVKERAKWLSLRKRSEEAPRRCNLAWRSWSRIEQGKRVGHHIGSGQWDGESATHYLEPWRELQCLSWERQEDMGGFWPRWGRIYSHDYSLPNNVGNRRHSFDEILKSLSDLFKKLTINNLLTFTTSSIQ